MKTYSQFLSDAWIPPFKPKSIRGGTKSPAQVAQQKASQQGRDSQEVRNKLTASVQKHGSSINDPRHSEIDYKHDEKTDTHTFTHKTHPVQVKYTPGDKPGSYIQNSTVTGKAENRVAAGRAMQNTKKQVSQAAKPGTTILSQPTTPRRATLNSRTQGMSDPNEKGVQAGIVRNRSPKQKAGGAKPLDPTQQKGIYIDPNH
jgi:hypothetical protein